MISRRLFLNALAKSAPVLGVGDALFLCACRNSYASGSSGSAAKNGAEEMIRKAPRARYWISTSQGADCLQCHQSGENLKENIHEKRVADIKCLLCAQGCMIRAGERGRCRARMNVNGELRSLVYGHPSAVHIDPIEKKPFYHFLPGSSAFSLATAGCPLHCKFCQNWEISQAQPEEFQATYVSPDSMVAAASSRQAPVIAFTYNEPTVFMEYLTDIARLAQKRNIRCVMVSCGFMNSEPLKEMCGVLNAIKIDLKGYSEDFYRGVCNAELRPVLRSIQQIAKSGIHLEIVNLMVPTLNDSETMMRGLVDWVISELGPDVPIHFTRFHPDYQLLNLPDTPIPVLERAREMALAKGVRYPYVGNVPGHPGNNTYCPGCKKAVITRNAFFVTEMNLKDGRCKFCGQAIAGVWS